MMNMIKEESLQMKAVFETSLIYSIVCQAM